jgi:hypothetical protein
MIMDTLLEWELAGQTQVLRENVIQYHFVPYKSHIPWPGRRGGKSKTNSLSYDTALYTYNNI